MHVDAVSEIILAEGHGLSACAEGIADLSRERALLHASTLGRRYFKLYAFIGRLPLDSCEAGAHDPHPGH